ncbi:MAG: PIG-L deacetylase family protein [Pirellulales bacterium]|jgi:LmbE family N-acetylglucosaminyl deacetylase
MSNSPPPSVLAIVAHPDDIEFSAAGTMLLLKQAGWQIHYFNVSGGDCGSTLTDRDETRRIRAAEARNAAAILGAEFYESVGHDMLIFFCEDLLRKVAAVVRQAKPRIVLTHSPQDYMEDHMNTCRLAVTAAFTHGMPNFETVPPTAPYDGDVTVYHAMPHGLCDGLRQPVEPDFYVDVESVRETKKLALAAHESQRAWLDASQGFDYLAACDAMSRSIGERSGTFAHAEGWRRHLHLGYSAEETCPLSEALAASLVYHNPKVEKPPIPVG